MLISFTLVLSMWLMVCVLGNVVVTRSSKVRHCFRTSQEKYGNHVIDSSGLGPSSTRIFTVVGPCPFLLIKVTTRARYGLLKYVSIYKVLHKTRTKEEDTNFLHDIAIFNFFKSTLPNPEKLHFIHSCHQTTPAAIIITNNIS